MIKTLLYNWLELPLTKCMILHFSSFRTVFSTFQKRVRSLRKLSKTRTRPPLPSATNSLPARSSRYRRHGSFMGSSSGSGSTRALDRVESTATTVLFRQSATSMHLEIGVKVGYNILPYDRKTATSCSGVENIYLNLPWGWWARISLISITETKKSTFSLLQDRAAWSIRFKVEYFYVKVYKVSRRRWRGMLYLQPCAACKQSTPSRLLWKHFCSVTLCSLSPRARAPL